MYPGQECVPPPPHSSQCPLGRLIFKKAMDGVRSPQKLEILDEDVSHHPWLSYFRIIKKPWMVWTVGDFNLKITDSPHHP